VKMWEGRQSTVDSQQSTENFAVNWFENRLNEVKIELEVLYKEFRLSEALKTIYSLVWDDFCSWYLEWVKPSYTKASEDKPEEMGVIDKDVYEKTVYFFEELMQLLHPFIPFITEEIYHELKERKEGDDITVKQKSATGKLNTEILGQGTLLKEVITALRDVRIKNQLKPKEVVKLHIQTSTQQTYESFRNILAKQVNASSMSFVNDSVSNSISTVVQKDKFYLETENVLDTSTQKEQLLKDLDYQKGFLASVEKKLSNEKFVNNAKPEVIDFERKKKADAEAKIKAIEESLQSL